MNYNTLIRQEKVSLSSQQITHFLKNIYHTDVKIVNLSDIQKYDNIDQMIGNNKFIVLFTPTNSKNDGHWQSMFINNNNLYFFDSYGKNPYYLINMINKRMPNNHYDLNDKFASLIKNSHYFPNNCYMNIIDYQHLSPSVNDCGRHVCIMLALRNKMKDFDFDEYYTYLNNILNNKAYKFENYDEIITYLYDELSK
jgi:hypothetical protein